MKMMIAVPCMDQVPVAFVESIIHMEKPESTAVCFKPNSLIYDARNLLSLTAIEHGFDYVMWMDSDMTFPRDTIPRLLNTLRENGGHMVSGLYVRRTMPTSPVIFDRIAPPEKDADGNIVKIVHDYTDYPRNAVFPIDGCGFGCVLVSVDLLKRVWDSFGPAFAPFAWGGEDISFCWRVKQLGEQILCDSRVKCGHVGSFVYTESLLGGDANGQR